MGKKNRKTMNSGQVIIPADHQNPPESHEVEAAYILARHYQTTVEFLNQLTTINVNQQI